MDDNFWKRIARNLAYIRKRDAILRALALIAGFAAFLLLIIARASAAHTGQIPWLLYVIVAVCVGFLILLCIYYEQE